MAADNQIEVLLTANFSDLQAGMAAGQSAVQQGTDAMSASFQSFQRDMETVQAAIGGNIRSFEELAVAETALDHVQQAGALSAEELAAAFKALDTAEANLAKGAVVATGAIQAQSAATVELGVINGGVAREAGVLFGEALRGNFVRMEGSVVTLANRMNLLQYVFSPVGLAVGGLVVGIGALGKAMYDAEEREAEWSRVLVETGGYVGLTADQIHGMAQEIADTGIPIGHAEDALHALAESGRFSGAQLGLAGQAAADMATVTGRSMDECVKAITALQDDPVKAILKLDDQYHFLKTTQFEEIEALEKQGNSLGAAQVAMQAYADAMRDRAQEVQKNLSFLDSFMNQVKEDASSMWQAIGASLDKNLLGIESQTAKIKDARDAYEDLNHRLQQAKSGHSDYLVTDMKALQRETDAAKQKFYALLDARDAAGKAAEKKGSDDQTQSAGNQGAAFLDKQDAALDKKVEKQREYTRAVNETAAALKAVRAAGGDTKGIGFDEKGDPSGAAWEKRKADISQEVGLTQQLAHAHNAVESAAKKAAEEAHKAALKGIHDANEAAKFRQQDAEATIKAIQKEAATQKQVDQIDLASARDTALAKSNLRKQQADADFASGKITAQQLAEIEKQEADEKLRIETAYYAAKKRLDAGDVVAIKQADAAILHEQEANASARLAIDNKMQAQLRQNAQKSADMIKRSMSGAFTGMLMQGQTFGSAMKGLFTTLAQTEIEKGIETLFQHQTVEVGKTTATVTGNSIRTASDVASTSTSMALTSQKGIQSIMTSGAETIGRVWSSIAAIPYVGPFLAPAMAIAAGAAVFKLASSIPSASGGWGQVPADTLAQIHKDEMVLPADLAKGVRDMARGGGPGGNTTHVHISALDMKSVATAMRRNPNALAGAVKYAHRMGHMGTIK